jgi:hypothetical protein
MMNNLQVGTLTGEVAASLISTKCTASSDTAQVSPGNIYLFGPYTGTTPPLPDDVDGLGISDPNGADPLSSAMVKLDTASGKYLYTIGFVPTGNYVLAYTCDPDQSDVDANLDNTPAGADEVVTFTAPTAGTPPVTVTAGQTTKVDFGP